MWIIKGGKEVWNQGQKQGEKGANKCGTKGKQGGKRGKQMWNEGQKEAGCCPHPGTETCPPTQRSS